MTGRKFTYFLGGFALGLAAFVILRVTGVLDAPLIDAMPWCVTIGVIAALLSGFIEQRIRRKPSQRQDAP